MKQLDIIALGNALTDITVRVREKDLKDLGIKKGSVKGIGSVDPDLFSKILSRCSPSYCQAGSPANTIFNAAKLGLKTGLIACLGNDYIGELYKRKLRANNIIRFLNKKEGDSGTCYILVAPDGERTNIASLGVSRNFDPNFSELDKYSTKVFHTSGYEVASNPEKTKEIVDYMNERRAVISFDLAADKMIRKHRKTIENIVEKTDILFATEEEAHEFTGLSPFKALDELSNLCPIVSLKRGKKGSVVKWHRKYKTNIYPTKLINTCGAGDAYAAGFLFAYIRGFNPSEWGKFGSYIASRVCSSESSHL